MPESQVSTLPLNKRLKNFSEVSLGFPRKIAVEEARRCPQYNDPAHILECPLGIDVLGFIRLLREGSFSGALKKIREQNALPAVCGRICLAPCEKIFAKGDNGSAIGIRALERFAADHGRERAFGRKPVERTGKQVAVVGSGPSGLAAAARLAEKNYRVSIFEALPRPGGSLRYGVAQFRLPKDVLDAELEELRLSGVEFHLNCPVGRIISAEELFNGGYQAVLMATGSGAGRSSLPGVHLGGVYAAEELLMQTGSLKTGYLKMRTPLKIGRQVVIMGATSQALDCGRICRRLGAEVTLIFAGTEEEMGVHDRDRIHAQEEGVKLELLTQTSAIRSDDGLNVSGVECARMDFADPDGSGQWQLIPVPESEFVLAADTVFLAGGELGESRIDNPPLRRDNGKIWVDESSGLTSAPAVFAAGAAVAGDPQLVAVMASGKKAADHIHQFLSKEIHAGAKNH